MSKFLRFIVNLCMICLLLSGVVLIVPQFAGVSTTIVDNDITDTNLSTGSVVYGRKVKLDGLEKGDSLLRSSGSSVHTSKIIKADPETGAYKVKTDNKTEDVTLRENGKKALLTVPVIGYLAMAIQTFEGRIILGLVIAFLVILFILSEIWRKNDDEDEDDQEIDITPDQEDDDVATDIHDADKTDENEIALDEAGETSDVEKGIQELILEPADTDTDEIEKESPMTNNDDDDFTAAIQAALEKEADAIPGTADTRAPGEDDDSEQGSEAEADPASDENGDSEEGDEAEADSTSDQNNDSEQENKSEEKSDQKMPDSKNDGREPELESDESENESDETEDDGKLLAMPAMTAEEIMQKAHEDGDDPKMIKDEEEGITLIDYSDVL